MELKNPNLHKPFPLAPIGNEGAQVLCIEKAGYTCKQININIKLGKNIDLGVVELKKISE